MTSYYDYSSRGRRGGHSEWVHLFLALMLIVVIKVLFRDTAPAPGLADIEQSVADMGVDDSNQPDSGSSAPAEASANLLEPPKVLLGGEAGKLLAEIRSALDAGSTEVIKLRDRLNKMLSMEIGQPESSWAREQLARLSEQWLFSKEIFKEDKICGSYEVRFGDTFTEIEGKFKTPYEMLMRINNIEDPRSLRAGKTMKVVRGPFHCNIYRSACRMDLLVKDMFVRSFLADFAEGDAGAPIGLWVVKAGGKHISPEGTEPVVRWIALEIAEDHTKERAELVIIGTRDSDKAIAASAQYIRVSDEDLKLIYDVLSPKASQVTVTE